MVTETSYEELSILQEKLDVKQKEFDEHKELERQLTMQLEESKKEKTNAKKSLEYLTEEQNKIKASLLEERQKVEKLSHTKV